MNYRELAGEEIAFICPIQIADLKDIERATAPYFAIVKGVLTIPLSICNDLHFAIRAELIEKEKFLEKFNSQLRFACNLSDDGNLVMCTNVYSRPSVAQLPSERQQDYRLGEIVIEGELFYFPDQPQQFHIFGTGKFFPVEEKNFNFCIYYSGEKELKCAVNPTIPCRDCREYISKLMIPNK